MVRRCPSCTASMAAMRPLMAAEPMLRAPRPEMVSESTVTGLLDCGTTGADSPDVGVPPPCVAAAASAAVAVPAAARPGAAAPTPAGSVSEASGATGDSVDFVPGITNRAFAIGTFASILLKVTFCRFWLPLRPFSMENGRYQPLTLL